MTLKFKYQKIGYIIMLHEKDWNRIVKFLKKSEIAVQEFPAIPKIPRAIYKIKSKKSK